MHDRSVCATLVFFNFRCVELGVFMKIYLAIEVGCKTEKSVLTFTKLSPDLPPGICWQIGMHYWDSECFCSSLRLVNNIEVSPDHKKVLVIFSGEQYESEDKARLEFVEWGGWIECDWLA